MERFFREDRGRVLETFRINYPGVFRIFIVSIQPRMKEFNIEWEDVFNGLPTQTKDEINDIIKKNITGERPDFKQRIIDAEKEAGIYPEE